ncbi:hypothetical protein CEXT_15831 [Caerostris extrusa]|uniref:Uncharacterized protein n=1 Tax=Caerostris extrusa TaxID=172846 RepID=A0AAV4XMV0_CAEEX|nr:hypothetical protein CEXT_15831 [Caerostris extrusa]
MGIHVRNIKIQMAFSRKSWQIEIKLRKSLIVEICSFLRGIACFDPSWQQEEDALGLRVLPACINADHKTMIYITKKAKSLFTVLHCSRVCGRGGYLCTLRALPPSQILKVSWSRAAPTHRGLVLLIV